MCVSANEGRRIAKALISISLVCETRRTGTYNGKLVPGLQMALDCRMLISLIAVTVLDALCFLRSTIMLRYYEVCRIVLRPKGLTGSCNCTATVQGDEFVHHISHSKRLLVNQFSSTETLQTVDI